MNLGAGYVFTQNQFLNNDDKKCNKNSTVNLLVVQDQAEKEKLTIIIENK